MVFKRLLVVAMLVCSVFALAMAAGCGGGGGGGNSVATGTPSTTTGRVRVEAKAAKAGDSDWGTDQISAQPSQVVLGLIKMTNDSSNATSPIAIVTLPDGITLVSGSVEVDYADSSSRAAGRSTTSALPIERTVAERASGLLNTRSAGRSATIVDTITTTPTNLGFVLAPNDWAYLYFNVKVNTVTPGLKTVTVTVNGVATTININVVASSGASCTWNSQTYADGSTRTDSGCALVTYRCDNGSWTLTSGSASCPNPTNHQPVISSITATPSSTGSMTIVFNASASDQDGDTLTYSWNFGDSASGSGTSPSHTYTNTGSYTVILAVSDGKGGATTSSINITVGSASATTGPLTLISNVEIADMCPTINGVQQFCYDFNSTADPSVYSNGYYTKVFPNQPYGSYTVTTINGRAHPEGCPVVAGKTLDTTNSIQSAPLSGSNGATLKCWYSDSSGGGGTGPTQPPPQ